MPAQASASAGESEPSTPPRWSERPSRPPSQPTPVAPGPKVSHISAGTSATRLVCSSSKLVRSPSTSPRRTVSHDTEPMASQVAENSAAPADGGSQAVISPPALPSNW